jgi:hypothetical protein
MFGANLNSYVQAAGQAGASGASEFLEGVIAITHVIPALIMIAGFGVLVHAAYFRAGPKKIA